jgi:hypothetical protein
MADTGTPASGRVDLDALAAAGLYDPEAADADE